MNSKGTHSNLSYSKHHYIGSKKATKKVKLNQIYLKGCELSWIEWSWYELNGIDFEKIEFK